RVKSARLIDEDRFARRDVAQDGKAQGLERDGLARHDVFATAHRFVDADDERTNAEGIAECDEAVARDHRDDRIRSTASRMDARDRRKDRTRIETRVMSRALELEREYVQQHLRVGV